MNFAHLASFQAIEFVDSGQISKNKSFLYKLQHSVIVVPEERAHDLILFPVSMLSVRTTSHYDPHFGDQEKERAAFSDLS